MAVYRGIATMTLDTGKCPRWLFERMVRLGREMVRVIVKEEGPEAFVRRIADPAWFQSLGTVLAFDWNASGLTTILTAALKEAIREEEEELGVFICGGKGKTSRRTPEQIYDWSDRLSLAPSDANALVYNSKMAAKVDSALIQDGYQIYHHTFFFAFSKKKHPRRTKRVEGLNDSPNISWTVVQQGMNTATVSARRYHWHSGNAKDLINEPHTGIITARRAVKPMNLTASESEKTRELSRQFVRGGYVQLMKDVKLLRKYTSNLSQMVELQKGPARHASQGEAGGEQRLKLIGLADAEFAWHPAVTEDFSKSKYLERILWKLADEEPENYEKLLATEGVGPKTIRALALVAEVIYGAKPSYEDPARYSFAHGGKDATPYPVDTPTYDQTIHLMHEYVKKSHMPTGEKRKALDKLNA